MPSCPPCPPRQAERTSRKAGLADRLVNGLSGENKRWSETIRRLEGQEGMLVGDVLLAAAFVSYAGPFNMAFRQGRPGALTCWTCIWDVLELTRAATKRCLLTDLVPP